MATIAEAVATIQFIGLCLFVPGPKDVTVILPKVPVQGGSPAEPVSPHQHAARFAVDSHTAIIAFEDRAGIVEKGWTSEELAPVTSASYRYIRLDGEKLTFNVRASNGRFFDTAGLPSVSGCRGRSLKRPPNLRAAFRPPSYPGAAAVAFIRNGELTACTAASGRVDTRLFLRNRGDLVIEGRIGNTTKSIRLPGDMLVLIGNVPTAWLDATAGSINEVGHHAVYRQMLERASECSGGPPAPVPGCDTTSPVRLPAGAPPVNIVDVPPEINAFMTSQCSNSQYP